jgi:hypothetical protein
MDVESRAVVRQKEAELAIRRKAAWIAKEARLHVSCVTSSLVCSMHMGPVHDK